MVHKKTTKWLLTLGTDEVYITCGLTLLLSRRLGLSPLTGFAVCPDVLPVPREIGGVFWITAHGAHTKRAIWQHPRPVA
jgi:hypothetical protein